MITPISLESDIDVVRGQIDRARRVGAQRFHIDIIDGLFADNITVAPADLQSVNLTGIDVDLHLLVDDPAEWLEECIALSPARIFAQIERMGSIEYFISALRGYGTSKVGIGVGLHTPLDILTDEILRDVDGVLLMAIEPGFGGTPFHEAVLPKIRELRSRWDGWIVIDGGITPETYTQVHTAGASEAGANSALWKGNFEENFTKFMDEEARW